MKRRRSRRPTGTVTVRLARWAGLLVLALILPGSLGALEESDRWTESWTVSNPAAETLVLDTIEGSIRVRGVGGNEIRLVIEKRLRAPTREEMEEIETMMPLRIDSRRSTIEVVVDAPWRDESGWRGDRHWDNPGSLRYDFTAEVPRDLGVVLKTVNAGEIRMEGVRGSFEVRNVNGGIWLEGLGAAGSAKAVNGPLVAAFSRSPEAACEFATVNGGIEVTFPGDFGADLYVETLNGEVYTELDYELGVMRSSSSERGGRQMRRLSRVVRLNGGGPELRFRTVNGDVEIRKGS